MSRVLRPQSRLAAAMLLLVAVIARPIDAQTPGDIVAPDSAPARRVPVAAPGASTITIFPDSLPDVPRTLSELLAAHAPGVVVQRSSGASGAGAWISFRDAAAATGRGPLVVVDGVRRVAIEAGSTTTSSRFGASTLDDIPVDQVERVELLRGPAATAAYGADARGGAIVITTRAPRGDGTRAFRAALTGGVVQNAVSFPRNFAYLDANGGFCYFTTPCPTPTNWTPLDDYQLFRDGDHAAVSANAAAALGRARMALGSTFDRTRGVLPSDGTDRSAGTLRLEVPLGARSRLALSSQAVFRGLALPRERGGGVVYAGITGYAKDCTVSDPCTPAFYSSDSASHGYATGRTPEELATDGMRERTRHFSQGLDFSSDVGAVTLRTRAGMDHYTLRGHDYLAPFVLTSPYFPPEPPPPHATSERTATRYDVEQQASVAERGPGFDGSTLFAIRFEKSRSKEADHSYTGGSGRATNVRTYDIRAEQQARVWDRVDAALGLRWSRFRPWRTGRAYPPRVDPWGSLALDVGDGVSLPAAGLTKLRLRAAAGRVSSYERAYDAPVILMPGTGFGGYSSVPAFPPEAADFSSEVEGGFDLSTSAGSARFAATAFRRADRFEELFLPVPQPSTGSGTIGRLGRATRGLELSLDLKPVTTPTLAWRVGTFATFTKDEMQSLYQPILTTSILTPYQTVASGASLGEWRAPRIGWNDANGDGRIGIDEVSSSGTPVSMGRSRPSRVAALTSTLTLDGTITLGATLDYRGGHEVLDLARALQCVRSQCAALYDASLDQATQAAAVLAGARTSLAGFLVPGDVLRLDDVSLTFTPRWLAQIGRGARPTLTLAARDIRLWSRAHLVDAETALPVPAMLGGTVDVPQPLTRSIELRLTATY